MTVTCVHMCVPHCVWRKSTVFQFSLLDSFSRVHQFTVDNSFGFSVVFWRGGLLRFFFVLLPAAAEGAIDSRKRARFYKFFVMFSNGVSQTHDCWKEYTTHPPASRVCAALPTLVKHCMALACPSTCDTDLLALGLQPAKLLAEVRARGSWIKEWIGHMV
jgi:hypothetical protein